MPDKKHHWHIEVWVPHSFPMLEDVFHYYVDTEDVTHMDRLCRQALVDFDTKYPHAAGHGCIAGTFAYDQFFAEEDLLANHPQDITHQPEPCDLCTHVQPEPEPASPPPPLPPPPRRRFRPDMG